MREDLKKSPRARRGQEGAVALEYVLTCAALVLVGAISAPVAVRIIGSAFEVIFAVVASPLPAAF